MLIVMTTFSSSEHDREDYDYAVFKMEKQEAQILARYFNLFKVMHDSASELAEMVYAAEDETLCEFYSEGIIDKKHTPLECIKELESSKGWTILPDDYDQIFTPKDAHAPAGTWLVICPQGFQWRAFPSESELTIETIVLPRELLSRVL